eukprot:Nk52_evm3s217 gene=Nk52_evmTU3s217
MVLLEEQERQASREEVSAAGRTMAPSSSLTNSSCEAHGWCRKTLQRSKWIVSALQGNFGGGKEAERVGKNGKKKGWKYVSSKALILAYKHGLELYDVFGGGGEEEEEMEWREEGGEENEDCFKEGKIESVCGITVCRDIELCFTIPGTTVTSRGGPQNALEETLVKDAVLVVTSDGFWGVVQYCEERNTLVWVKDGKLDLSPVEAVAMEGNGNWEQGSGGSSNHNMLPLQNGWKGCVGRFKDCGKSFAVVFDMYGAAYGFVISYRDGGTPAQVEINVEYYRLTFDLPAHTHMDFMIGIFDVIFIESFDYTEQPLLCLLFPSDYHGLSYSHIECLAFDFSTRTIKEGPWRITNVDPSSKHLLRWSSVNQTETNYASVVSISAGQVLLYDYLYASKYVYDFPELSAIACHCELLPGLYLILDQVGNFFQMKISRTDSKKNCTKLWEVEIKKHQPPKTGDGSFEEEEEEHVRNASILNYFPKTGLLLVGSPSTSCCVYECVIDAVAVEVTELRRTSKSFNESFAPVTCALPVESDQLTTVFVACGVDKACRLMAFNYGLELTLSMEGPEFPVSPNLMALKRHWCDRYDSFLIFSYDIGSKTLVLSIEEEEFCEVELPGISQCDRTLSIGNTPNDQIIQVTPREVRVISSDDHVETLEGVFEQSVVKGGVIIACSGSQVQYITVVAGKPKLQKELSVKETISALAVDVTSDIGTGGEVIFPSCDPQFIVLGQWGSNRVDIVRCMDWVTVAECEYHACPRSISFIRVKSTPTKENADVYRLVVGLADGIVVISECSREDLLKTSTRESCFISNMGYFSTGDTEVHLMLFADHAIPYETIEQEIFTRSHAPTCSYVYCQGSKRHVIVDMHDPLMIPYYIMNGEHISTPVCFVNGRLLPSAFVGLSNEDSNLMFTKLDLTPKIRYKDLSIEKNVHELTHHSSSGTIFALTQDKDGLTSVEGFSDSTFASTFSPMSFGIDKTITTIGCLHLGGVEAVDSGEVLLIALTCEESFFRPMSLSQMPAPGHNVGGTSELSSWPKATEASRIIAYLPHLERKSSAVRKEEEQREKYNREPVLCQVGDYSFSFGACTALESIVVPGSQRYLVACINMGIQVIRVKFTKLNGKCFSEHMHPMRLNKAQFEVIDQCEAVSSAIGISCVNDKVLVSSLVSGSVHVLEFDDKMKKLVTSYSIEHNISHVNESLLILEDFRFPNNQMEKATREEKRTICVLGDNNGSVTVLTNQEPASSDSATATNRQPLLYSIDTAYATGEAYVRFFRGHIGVRLWSYSKSEVDLSAETGNSKSAQLQSSTPIVGISAGGEIHSLVCVPRKQYESLKSLEETINSEMDKASKSSDTPGESVERQWPPGTVNWLSDRFTSLDSRQLENNANNTPRQSFSDDYMCVDSNICEKYRDQLTEQQQEAILKRLKCTSSFVATEMIDPCKHLFI